MLANKKYMNTMGRKIIQVNNNYKFIENNNF
jgi:hypothetical protein